MVFKGTRLSVGRECAGEEFLVTVHDDGSAQVSTRTPADPSWYWSPPVRLAMETTL